MKKITSVVLCVFLLSLGVTAMAENRILRDNDEFSLSLGGLNGVEAHTFTPTLAAGDSLEIVSDASEGTISITIDGPEGPVYESSDSPAGAQIIPIDADGEYTATVHGENAVGNAWIRVLRANAQANPDGQLAQSPLGYATQYNPEYFTFESYGTYDYFMPAGQDGGLVDTFMIISIQSGSAQSLIDDLLSEAETNPENGAYEELPAMEVDSYPMRTLRFAGAGNYEGTFYDYYLIELEAEKTLFAQSSFTAGSEDMGEQMQLMMQNMYLTK